MVSIPNDKVKDLLSGKKSTEFNFLAFKILLSRLRLNAANDPGLLNLMAYKAEIVNLFEKNMNIPNAQKDLNIILGKE